MFLDYLKMQEFPPVIIFYGRSGSGKSSYAQFVKEQHPIYTVVDEVWSPLHIIKLAYLKYRYKNLIVCSHLNKGYFRFFTSKAFYNLDHHPEKIQHALNEKGYEYSDQSIQQFCRLFKTSFVDLDIILEKSQGNNFDAILTSFIKNNHISLRPNYQC